MRLRRVLSSSGQLSKSRFTVVSILAHQSLNQVMIRTPPHTLVRRSSASVYPAGSCVVRRAVSVRHPVFFLRVTRPCFPDISDFLVEEIRGPASFSCKSGQGCRFEEPAMNSLINDIFGDAYITLNCEGGECLHYSQVPGYHVCVCLSCLCTWLTVDCVGLRLDLQRPAKPDNTKWIALSSAGAGLIVILTVAGGVSV